MATVESGARLAAANPWLELLERLGYVVRGALYCVMGILALRVALSQPGGAATDLTGSLVYLIGNSWGKLILLVAIVGLTAYSIWGFARAIFDPLHRGSDPSGYMERLGFVSSAISYGAIVIFGLKLLIGSGSGSTDSTKQAIVSVLDHPAGGLLTIVIGLIAVGIGIGQFVEAYRAVFRADLKGTEMTESEQSIAVALGRFGMFARGVIFLIVGWFVLQAGIHHAPAQVQGFGGALLFLLAKPFGHVLLGIVALGLVALGLHSLACARWIRLMGSSA
jgi:membrane protein implicated in regulation of membrane protease activity